MRTASSLGRTLVKTALVVVTGAGLALLALISSRGRQIAAIGFLIFLCTVSHFLVPSQKGELHEFLFKVTYLPIILAALWFGMQGGLAVSTVTSALYLAHLDFQMGGHLFTTHLGWTLDLVLYNGIALVTGGLAQAQARARQRAEGLVGDLEHSNVELRLTYDSMIEGWARALDLRDKEIEGHSERVTDLAERLGRAMGISQAELVHIRWGALLHDIGKMAIPDGILHKPAALTEDEWRIMRKHPVYAYEMLRPIAYLHRALDIPYCHHEKWDGTGYPRGLKGKQIPLAARLFAFVDVWDALISNRPYRPAWAKEKAREHFRSEAGKHFDPQVVETFLKLTEEAQGDAASLPLREVALDTSDIVS